MNTNILNITKSSHKEEIHFQLYSTASDMLMNNLLFYNSSWDRVSVVSS